MARKVAKAWGVGSHRGRGAESGVVKSARLKVMKGTVVPSLTTFCRSRAWSRAALGQIQRVANYAVRRAMGMDIHNMREWHVSDAAMYKAVGWESMADVVRRLSLSWLGHVARMPIHRTPKIAIFGWLGDRKYKMVGAWRGDQTAWFAKAIKESGVDQIDWFRVAQDRKAWKRMIDKQYPLITISKNHARELDAWGPGKALPVLEHAVRGGGRGKGKGKGGQIPDEMEEEVDLWADIEEEEPRCDESEQSEEEDRLMGRLLCWRRG